MTKISISSPKRGFHVGSAAAVGVDMDAARGLPIRVAEVEADVDGFLPRAVAIVLLISAVGLVAAVGVRVLLLLLPGPGADGRVRFAPAPALGLLVDMTGGE